MSAFLTALLLASLSMSGVILLLLLLNKLSLSKIPAKFRYYTWLIVLIGLLIPFRPDITLPFAPIALPVNLELAGDAPVVVRERIQNDLQTNLPQDSSPLESGAMTSTPPVVQEIGETSLSYVTVLFGIWIAGALAMLAFHILSYGRFVSNIRKTNIDIADEHILSTLREIQNELGLNGKPITVGNCKLVSSPMLIGFLKPVILLPEKQIALDELDCIFRHELTHYKRKDLWMNLLLLLVSSMHWFNPIVHLMAKAVRVDCEMACDEAVVVGLDTEERRQYGETIIGFIGTVRTGALVLSILSTNFYGGKNTMERRLFIIMDAKRKSKKLAALCVTTIIVATLISGNVLTVSASAVTPTGITLTEALDAVMAFMPNSKTESFELINGDRPKAYQFTVMDGNDRYVFIVNAASGEIESFMKEALPAQAAPLVQAAPTAQTYVPPAPVQQFPAQQMRANMIGADEARGIALSYLGSGTVVRHETKKDCYKVCIQEGNWHHDVEVFFNGTVKQYKVREITFTGSKAFAWNQSGVIGFSSAAITATNRTGGGTVIENKLDYKKNEGLVYKVKVVSGQTEYKVEMFATTGTIYKFETKYKS